MFPTSDVATQHPCYSRPLDDAHLPTISDTVRSKHQVSVELSGTLEDSSCSESVVLKSSHENRLPVTIEESQVKNLDDSKSVRLSTAMSSDIVIESIDPCSVAVCDKETFSAC